MFGAYRRLWSDLRAEWRRDRNFVYYLVVSAVFRDGLAGIFAFGAVLGVSVYGISQADVLIFGVVASTVAARARSSAVVSMTGSAPSRSSSPR